MGNNIYIYISILFQDLFKPMVQTGITMTRIMIIEMIISAPSLQALARRRWASLRLSNAS